MKAHLLSLALLTSLVISCSKKEDVKVEPQLTKESKVDIYSLKEEDPESKVGITKMRYFLDGKEVLAFNKHSNIESSITVYYAKFPGKMFQFTTRESFKKWALSYSTSFGNKLLESSRQMDEINKLATNKNFNENDKQLLNALASYKPSFSETLLKSTAVLVLYEHIEFNGNNKTYPLGAPIPSFGSFNNVTSSFKAMGGSGALCDKKWFGGARFYFLAAPYIHFRNLVDHDYNDKAESFSPL